MIQAHNLVKSYQNGATETTVLKGVSLNVESGEFLFLVGPSGSGKSTLLSILGCVLAADQGTLEMMGTQVWQLPARELTLFRRDHLGFVFQRYHLFPGLSSLENVRVPLDLQGVHRAEGNQRAAHMLAAVGLAEKSNSPINRLSMGQRQRVAVARALVAKPQIVFADEPTASLDADSGRMTIELMRDLAKQRQTTVVVVTHDARILGYADRVLHLENGHLTTPADELDTTSPPSGRVDLKEVATEAGAPVQIRPPKT